MGFDYKKFKELQGVLKKQGQFVPMDPSAMAGGDPAAMAGGDPAAMAGGDPAAMAGGDPAAMAGGPPPPTPGMGPSAMGLPPGMDLASIGSPGGEPSTGDISPTGEPYMKITPTQLSKLFKQFAEVFKSVLGIQTSQPQQSIAQEPAAPQQDPALEKQLAEVNAKLDAVIGGVA